MPADSRRLPARRGNISLDIPFYRITYTQIQSFESWRVVTKIVTIPRRCRACPSTTWSSSCAGVIWIGVSPQNQSLLPLPGARLSLWLPKSIPAAHNAVRLDRRLSSQPGLRGTATLRAVASQVFHRDSMSPGNMVDRNPYGGGQALALNRAGGEVSADDRFHLFPVQPRRGDKLFDANPLFFQVACDRL